VLLKRKICSGTLERMSDEKNINSNNY
jgi:hypothetical protein